MPAKKAQPQNDITRSSLELLYHISRELASTIDLRSILGRVLTLAVRNVSAERGSLIVVDEDREPVDAAIMYHDQLIQHTLSQLQATIDSGLAGWVMRNGKSVLINDTSKDERWLRRPDDTRERTGSKSALCLPLVARERLVGVLTLVHSEPGFFNHDHLALLQSIADQASIAIFNALLYDKLESVNRRYRELFEDNIDPIFITDWQGKILEANRQAERSTGYDREELQRHTIFDLEKVKLDLLVSEAGKLQQDETVTFESTLTRKDNRTIPLQVYVRRVNIDGEYYLQWISRDISERVELDGMRDSLVAMIYHDLRSPLSNIISSLQLIESTSATDPHASIASLLGIANRSTARLQRLIDSLLDINRLETGQPITNQSKTNLQDLTADAVDAVRSLNEVKQQTVEIIRPDEPITVFVDADMIRRVIINLLENATKFTPTGGNVKVGCAMEDEHAKVWVKDNGPGIPLNAQQRIFEKYVRLREEGAPKGLGLGLAFCQLAVHAHGGRIWVESRKNEGSCFLFTLPVANQND